MKIQLTQLEEKAEFSGVNTEMQPADACFTLSPGLRPQSPLFLGTRKWTYATNGRRFNNKTWLLAFHFRPGIVNLVSAPFQAAAR